VLACWDSSAAEFHVENSAREREEGLGRKSRQRGGVHRIFAFWREYQGTFIDC
jgi:hypothetical protein